MAAASLASLFSARFIVSFKTEYIRGVTALLGFKDAPFLLASYNLPHHYFAPDYQETPQCRANQSRKT